MKKDEKKPHPVGCGFGFSSLLIRGTMGVAAYSSPTQWSTAFSAPRSRLSRLEANSG